MFKNIRKIENALEISEGIIDDITKLTCYSNEKIYVENYLGIIEYEDYMIRLNTSDGEVYIYGIDLNIGELTKDEMVITGKINNIQFER
ncbi:MAG: hypothetical protein E7311_06315 [Clostridiales bacterium]|nr:hypothetical protein [Clostridiales bacterium]